MSQEAIHRPRRSNLRHLFRIPLIVAALCFSSIGRSAEPEKDLAIEDVTVISMTRSGEVLRDMTVVIRSGRIHSIARSGTRSISPGTRVIDGRGKWLMPALADMHVHVESDELLRLYLRDPTIPTGTISTADALLPYVANGVLQVAVLSGTPATLAQCDEVESGRTLGPHMAVAAMIDGSPPIWPPGMTRVAATPADGREQVRAAHREGYQLIKVYSQLDLDTFLAIVDEARKLGMPVTGHLQRGSAVPIESLFVPGFGMVAHAEEFALHTRALAPSEIEHYAQIAKRNGTWLTATLTADERFLEQTRDPTSLRRRPEIDYLAPRLQTMVLHANPYVQQASPARIEFLERVVDFNRKLVPAFAAAGVPVVAGTDALVPGVVPGFSLHDELVALSRAGLTNKQVLEAATRLPAEWLGTIDDRGEIVAGKRADLVLLTADPLQDVANTRRIFAVIANGRFLPETELSARLETLARKQRLK